MALTDSLISYWSLGEASGNALDAHGSNELTETSGTIASATGKVGNCRDFEAGDTEYFERADNADLSTGDIDFTWQAWVNLESGGADRVILAKVSAAPVFEYILRYRNSTQKFEFIVFNSSAVSATAAWSATASTGTWYHVVGWHDAAANQVGIAVNAGTAVTAAHSTGVHDGTGGFAIGREGERNADYWDGLIDEVGLWKRVLTSDERTTLYNGGSGLAYPFVVIADGAGASAGSASVSGAGASAADGVGASAGPASVSGVGAALADGAGASSGSASASAAGAPLADGAATSSGSASPLAVSSALAATAGASAGAGSASAVGAAALSPPAVSDSLDFAYTAADAIDFAYTAGDAIDFGYTLTDSIDY